MRVMVYVVVLYKPYADRCLQDQRMTWKSATAPGHNHWAGLLEVLRLSKQDVLWKESHHEACQEVTGASVINILLLPEISRDSWWVSLKFWTRVTALPSKIFIGATAGIAPIATLGDLLLVIAHESWLHVAVPPGAAGHRSQLSHGVTVRSSKLELRPPCYIWKNDTLPNPDLYRDNPTCDLSLDIPG